MIRILFLVVATSVPVLAGWEVRPDEHGIEILENGESLTRCRFDRVPSLYPLPSASGANLARHWPIEDDAAAEERDHPHHRSLWLSHGDVNGYDFWAWQSKGEPSIRHLETRDVEANEDHAAFTLRLDWVADGRSQLTEVRRFRLSRPDPETLAIEVTATLTAGDEAVILGDTKEGTFALRVDRTLRLKGPQARGHITDSEGRTDDQCWGKRSDWVAFHGPDEKSEPAVIAMFDHPSNLRHPTWWHARDYGLLAANPFGIHDFEQKADSSLGRHVIGKGKSLTLRYLVILHHGNLSSAKLAERWTDFSR